MLKKSQTGFTLVEILISVLIMSFGLLSLGGLQITSVKGVMNANSHNVASMFTMELGERMRSNPLGVSGGFYGGSVNCLSTIKQCRGSEACTAQQTASFDLQEITCGTMVENIRQGGVRNLLPQGTLSVACPAGCDQPDAVHNITIQWGNNVAHKDQSDSAKIATLTTGIIP